MPRLCVFGCKVPNDKSVTMHAFPKPDKDPERFIVWVNLVNSVIPSKLGHLSPEEIYYRCKVCSRHFDVTDWNRNNRLNALAVPALNLPDFQDGKVIPVPSAKCIKVFRSAMKLVVQNNIEDCSEIEYLESIYDSDEYEENTDKLHEGYKCNICSGDIIGFRYRCVQCSDLDMCLECETKGEHKRHYVLRIPEPRPFSEIHSVLEKIRKVLMSGEDQLLSEQPSEVSLDDDCDDFRLEIDTGDEDPMLFEDNIDVKTKENPVKSETIPVKSDLVGVKGETGAVKTEMNDVEIELIGVNSSQCGDEKVHVNETAKTSNAIETPETYIRPISQIDSSTVKKVTKKFDVLIKRNKRKKSNVLKKIMELNNDTETQLSLLMKLDDEDEIFCLNKAWSSGSTNVRTYKRVKKS